MIHLARPCLGKLILSWVGPSVFYAGDVGAVPAGVPGVYVLSAFTKRDPTLVPFYVGQSCDVRRRLTEHLIGQRTFAKHLRSHLPTYFHVAVVSDPAIRAAAEAALIWSLSPVGNDVVPAAPPIELNPPKFTLLDP